MEFVHAAYWILWYSSWGKYALSVEITEVFVGDDCCPNGFVHGSSWNKTTKLLNSAVSGTYVCHSLTLLSSSLKASFGRMIFKQLDNIFQSSNKFCGTRSQKLCNRVWSM